MTFRWIPWIVSRGPDIEARDKIHATEIALDRYGADLVRIQSVASHDAEADDLAAAEQRRRREDDGA